jgi:hypothetical protein
MIKIQKINGLIFLEQRSYYIYESEDAKEAGRHKLFTSDVDNFQANKKLARHNKKLKGKNKFIVL